MLLTLLLGQGTAGPAQQNLSPSRFDNTQTFFTASSKSTSTLSPGLFTNSQTYYTSVVTQTGGAQTLVPNLYSNAQTFYSPSVKATRTLTAARFDNNNTFYSLSAASRYNLSPTRYDNNNTVYLGSITKTNTLAPSRVDNTQTWYAHIIDQTGATHPVLPDLFVNANSFFTSKLTFELDFKDWVDPGHVEPGWVGWPYFNANQFFSPTITAAKVFVYNGTQWIPAVGTQSYTETGWQIVQSVKTFDGVSWVDT